MANAVIPPSPPTKSITLSVNVFRTISEHPDWYHASTRELEIPFPEEFQRSTNRRFVKVLSIRAIQLRKLWYDEDDDPVSVTIAIPKADGSGVDTREKTDAELIAANCSIKSWEEYLPDLYTLHASFIYDDYNDDQTVAWLNEPLTEPRVYEQFQNNRTFRLWVVDSAAEKYNKRVDLSKPYDKSNGFLHLPITNNIVDSYKYYYVLVIQLLLEF